LIARLDHFGRGCGEFWFDFVGIDGEWVSSTGNFREGGHFVNSDSGATDDSLKRMSWKGLLCALSAVAVAFGHSALTAQTVFDANERVDVIVPDHSLVLAQPAQIQLRIRVAGLSSVGITQIQDADEEGAPISYFIQGGDETQRVAYGTDGKPYLTIVPMRLGRVGVQLVGRFPDGGMIEKEFDIDVKAPDQEPTRLSVGHIGLPTTDTPVLFLSINPGRRRDALILYATYPNVAVPVEISPSFASFRVFTGSDASPIRLDVRTGRLTAVHQGQALVETTFGGRTNLTCVVVEQEIDPNRSEIDKDCRTLVPKGRRLGPSEWQH
jgi:hypothetical protein